MDNKDNCKGCSRSVRTPSEDILKLIEEIKSGGEFSLVTDEIYAWRLEQCSSCEYLEYETTCLQCGCFVQIRALMADKDCPHIRESKWCGIKD
jgi:hypothetical protein